MAFLLKIRVYLIYDEHYILEQDLKADLLDQYVAFLLLHSNTGSVDLPLAHVLT